MNKTITLSLDGEWQLFHFPEGEHILASPRDLVQAALPSIPALVPGNVELDLQRSGQLPEPFFGANFHLLRPLETHEWWYARQVEIPADFYGKSCDLIFEGLDTFATVWVNDVQVGQSSNMLVEQVFDVTRRIRPGQQNTIVVRIAAAVSQARNHSYEAGASSWEHRFEGLYVRKPPHVWGWDILPRAVSAGIWRPVRLQTRPDHAIDQLYYWTASADARQAVLGVFFQVRTHAPEIDGFSLRITGTCGDHRFQYDWPLEFISDSFKIPIPGAKLWWPVGYGEVNLYTVTAQLLRGSQVFAERTDRIGIRKVVVDRTEITGQVVAPEPASGFPARLDVPPSPASHFVITVNAIPILIKGTNWVPLDAFHSRDAGRLAQALAMVQDLGCNMIRCWGGNVYESESFFDWCDEHGVLVWQDFAFACCLYPQDEAFLSQVRHEADQIIRRLRNHPSLAIWCGDNENDMFYLSESRDPQLNQITRQILPLALQSHDPYRHYIPSSPYVPPALVGHPNAWQLTPEQHLWGPRGYYKSPFYTHHSAHFIGEIGYHGCPAVSSIQKFIPPGRLWPWQSNEEWQAHSVYHWQNQGIDRDRIQLMANQIKELFGFIPEDLATFVLASQITQAEAKKFFIESTRLRKWSTSGILWWNLVDGWPQFSDAVVDYYFQRKLAYEYIRRVQRPVCVMIGEPGSGKYLPVVIGNDSCQDSYIQYHIRDADTLETAANGFIHIPANENWQVDLIRTYAGEQRLYLIEWQKDSEYYGNHYLVGTPPFNLEGYMNWLIAIAALPQPFNPGQAA